MPQRIATISFLCLALPADSAWCDWDDLFDHHDSRSSPAASPELEFPELDFFMTTVFLIVAASGAVLFLAGPLLIYRARRIRDIVVVVPLTNLAIYLLSIYLRTYPQASTAQFRSPNVWCKVFEVALLGLSSFVVVSLLATIQWFVHRLRSTLSGKESVAEPAHADADR